MWYTPSQLTARGRPASPSQSIVFVHQSSHSRRGIRFRTYTVTTHSVDVETLYIFLNSRRQIYQSLDFGIGAIASFIRYSQSRTIVQHHLVNADRTSQRERERVGGIE